MKSTLDIGLKHISNIAFKSNLSPTGVVDTPKGWAAVQRDLNRLEEPVYRSLKKLKK